MPLKETRVVKNQLVTIIAKEQFSKDYRKIETFWTYSGIAGQKCVGGSMGAFDSVRMKPVAKARNRKSPLSLAGI